MKKLRKVNILVAIIAGIIPVMSALGAYTDTPLPEAELAKLGITGTELTPMGAIRAGNADGSIPAWTGGLIKPPAGYKDGGPYIDPYASDKPLFTITKDNYKQYAANLVPGQIAMFERYPDYTMIVYPTRRSAGYSNEVYEATLKAARTSKRCGDRCLEGTPDGGGIPFPIPKDGQQVLFNRANAYYGNSWTAPKAHAFVTQPDGSYIDNESTEYYQFGYWYKKKDKSTLSWLQQKGGSGLCYTSETTAPARSAGQIAGGCNFAKDYNMNFYLYVPGQRRVRKAPDLGFYDQPGNGSDGLRTADQRWGIMMTGDVEWYDYKLHGRKEIYIPYNNYRLADPSLNFDDLIKKGHLNQKYIRYEKHRVWEVEMTLKPGFRHMSPHRFFYLDEDSWSAALAVMYNDKGTVWRVSEEFNMNFYNVPMTYPWGDAHYDLSNGRYTTTPLFFNQKMPDFTWRNDEWFTPTGLRRFGVK